MRPFRSLVLVGALAGISSLAAVSAPPRTASAEPAVEVDLSFFYDSLAPHGEWVRVEPYGSVFVPEVDVGWRPYTVGQWVWAEPFGWVFVTDDDWGWIVFHYGRWTYVDDFGWAWVPGVTWAPAWVSFRIGEGFVGWAPIPPGPDYRIDAAFDPNAFNVEVAVSAYAWSFVPTRAFADPDVRSRVVVSAYNPALVRSTRHSTNFVAVDGGVANRSIDVALVEKARGTPVPRLHAADVGTVGKGVRTRVEGDRLVLPRPRISSKTTSNGPTPRGRTVTETGPAKNDMEAWAAKRRAALDAHYDAQKKAIERGEFGGTGMGEPPATGEPAGMTEPRGMGDPAMGAPPVQPAPPTPNANDDAQKRRQAALEALEAEKKRMEALFERQRKRREQDLQPPPTQNPPPQQPPPKPPPDHDHTGMK